MATKSFYPVLMTKHVAASASFYREVFGFEVVFESDWYVSLRLGDFELALLASDHESIPEMFRQPVRGGLLLNIEVDDVDAVYETVRRIQGVIGVQDLRDEDFGQRHFIVQAPDDVLVDVIQPIEPSPEFAAAHGL